MKVSELVAELMKLDQDLPVEILVWSAVDSAFTKAEIEVMTKEGCAQVGGWVASDDEDAYFPGV